jgi:hypothetical protein
MNKTQAFQHHLLGSLQLWPKGMAVELVVDESQNRCFGLG